MPSLKLSHFNTKGGAEHCRLAFFMGGVEFEDKRLSREEWGGMKAAGFSPMGGLPVLEVDGKKICQSKAILNYAGRAAGLYPTDAFEAAKVDELINGMDDVFEPFRSTFAIQDLDEKIKKRQELLSAEGKMGQMITAIDKLVASNGGKCAAGGDKVTIADIALTTWIDFMTSGAMDGVAADTFEKYPGLKGVVDNVRAHPKYIEWNAMEH
mmetsp:Transcript_26936/g.42088  ORF Transcript_26936/g.42088 Transcript_26936/m.42088 type:complete len:210 (-) Transcript_26936:200-829(-)